MTSAIPLDVCLHNFRLTRPGEIKLAYRDGVQNEFQGFVDGEK